MSSLKFRQEKGGEDELMRKALDVSDVDTDEELGPPMDGMAYLKQVIKERKRIADTVTVDIDPEKIKKPYLSNVYSGGGRVKPNVPAQYTPSASWQNQQISEFSDVRRQLTRHLSLLKSKEELKPLKLPDRENEMLWCLFCYGNSVWQSISESRRENESDAGVESDGGVEDAEAEEGGEEAGGGREETKDSGEPDILAEVINESRGGTDPLLRVILSMPVHLVERVLEYQVSWVQSTGWRAEYGPWIYSLLCRVEKPLTPDLGSVLRDLALFCSQERAKLVGKNPPTKPEGKPTNGDVTGNTGEEEPATNAEEVEMNFDRDIAAFNLFICIVAKYFNQGDLADSDL